MEVLLALRVGIPVLAAQPPLRQVSPCPVTGRCCGPLDTACAQ